MKLTAGPEGQETERQTRWQEAKRVMLESVLLQA